MKPVDKKLIEVALPLDAINKASAREKSIRHGHPSTLHLWWARRPLAAARAVLFAQMVDDPSAYVEELLSDQRKKKTAARELKKRLAQDKASQNMSSEDSTPNPRFTLEEVAADLERDRLFKILEDLVLWESTTNETVLQQARDEIWKSWRRTCAENADHPRAKEIFNRNELPCFHDPFAGGGALPLEAQRLGLKSYASDLNPVAVLINKAMIEIPPKFAGRPPVNPEWTEKTDEEKKLSSWIGAEGLAEDISYYGRWMREEAKKRIGHLYPEVEITEDIAVERPDLVQYVGRKLTVIAWIWVRTVRSPNPAFADVHVPLASTFMLSAKQGKKAYVEPRKTGERGYQFNVKVGIPKDIDAVKLGTKLSRGANFQCLMSGTPIADDYIKFESVSGRLGECLMAIVAEGDNERVYLKPTSEHQECARMANPEWRPDQKMNNDTRDLVSGRGYGFFTWSELFTPRQLVVLTSFSDLVSETVDCAKHHAITAGLPDDGTFLNDGGITATAYAEAVGTYLALVVDKCSDYWSSICTWNTLRDNIRSTFARQAIPMVWDFAEANPFSNSSGNWTAMVDWTKKAVQLFPCDSKYDGSVELDDAQVQTISTDKLVSTDPPYYDNIGYADLSDFFYVWLRHSLKPIFPDLFTTLAVPKREELVASSYRHGGREKAEQFFLEGMTQAMKRLVEQTHPALPVTIYYAFKQSEKRADTGNVSTGWEAFLKAVISAGFSIVGTWPMRTERTGRMIGVGTNALASSIILVCRKHPSDAPLATRHEFINALKTELPKDLAHMQRVNIAPVDLAQASIGPGMAIYTRYSQVLNARGEPVSVRDALILINRVLDEVFSEREGDFDADTRWALEWFKQQGFTEGDYGVAETLSKAKNISVDGLVEAGILSSRAGKVRLLRPDELPKDWDPVTDKRLTVWEIVHHLVRVLESGGEEAASRIAFSVGSKTEAARELCYQLYTSCENKKRAIEARWYNSLVCSWPEINRLAREDDVPEGIQTSLFDGG